MVVDVKPELVLAKTGSGVREVAERRRGLSLRVRRVLILIDGKTRVDKLERMTGGTIDVVGCVQTLLSQELVAPVPGAVTQVAADARLASSGQGLQEQLVQVARLVLGDHAERVVARLESGGASAELLGVSVNACFKLIRLTIDEKKADEFRRRALGILSSAE